LKLRAAQVDYDNTKDALEKAQKRLDMAVKHVQKLEEEFAEMMRRQEELIQQTADCENKIASAHAGPSSP